MTVNSSIGPRLSRELTPISGASAPELLPLTEARERLVTKFDAAVSPGVLMSECDIKQKSAAAGLVESELRDALHTRAVDAYVHHPDGRLFRIPNCYWGSFHDYRPLCGEGLLTLADHGALAFECNGQGVFLDKRQADLKWLHEIADDALPENAMMRALVMEAPAALDGIGPVSKLVGAIDRFAFGKASNDTLVYTDGKGNLTFRYADGTAVTKESAEAEQNQYQAGFSQTIAWLRQGDLPSYVAEQGSSQAYAIPRLYWNSNFDIEAHCLYRGFAGQELLRGLPVLVANADVERLCAAARPAPQLDGESRSRNLTGSRVDDGAMARRWDQTELADFARGAVNAGKTQAACEAEANERWPDNASRPTRNMIRSAYHAAMTAANLKVSNGRPRGSKTRREK